MGTLTIRRKIQWIAGDFLACAVKLQHLCLLYSALDQAKTCSDELLAAWLLQVQQFLIDLLLSKKPCAVAESEVNAG